MDASVGGRVIRRLLKKLETHSDAQIQNMFYVPIWARTLIDMDYRLIVKREQPEDTGLQGPGMAKVSLQRQQCPWTMLQGASKRRSDHYKWTWGSESLCAPFFDPKYHYPTDRSGWQPKRWRVTNWPYNFLAPCPVAKPLLIMLCHVFMVSVVGQWSVVMRELGTFQLPSRVLRFAIMLGWLRCYDSGLLSFKESNVSCCTPISQPPHRVADWCSGLHAESILTPGLPITSMSVSHEEHVLPSEPQPSGQFCGFEATCPWGSTTQRDGKPHWEPTEIGALAPQEQIELLESTSSPRHIHDGILVLNTSGTAENCLVPRLTSPVFSGSLGSCFLELHLYAHDGAMAERLNIMIQSSKGNLSAELQSQGEETVPGSLVNGVVKHSLVNGEVNYSLVSEEVNYSLANGVVNNSLVNGEVNYSLVSEEVNYSLVSEEVNYSLVNGEVNYSLVNGKVNYSLVNGKVNYSLVNGKGLFPEAGRYREIEFGFRSVSDNPLINGPNLSEMEQREEEERSGWRSLTWKVGGMDEPFQISLGFASCGPNKDHILVLDSLILRNCFADFKDGDLSTCPMNSSFLCETGGCISRMKVCDFQIDCPGGNDEGPLCGDLLPAGAHCSFEEGTCGWTFNSSAGATWLRTDPSQIHQRPAVGSNVLLYTKGLFLHLEIDRQYRRGKANVYSGSLPRPVSNRVCQFSFKYFIYGAFNGSLAVYALEENEVGSPIKIWEIEGSGTDFWSTAALEVPRFHSRFRLEFLALWGWDSRAQIAIDNVTFSVDCFHTGRIETRNQKHGPSLEAGPLDNSLQPLSESFYTDEAKGWSKWHFTSCDASGAQGPTQTQCDSTYRNTNISVDVVKDGPLRGIQTWRVPYTNMYTISAYGAAGGKGAKNRRRSHGVFISGVFQLQKDEVLYILVGQQGEDACPGRMKATREICMGESSVIEDEERSNKSLSDWAGGGGGGGGATFVFKEVNGVLTPLLIAAGGGGKSYLEHPDGALEFAALEQFENSIEIPGLNGRSGAAGGGGGWNDVTELPWAGRSLMEGGEGGQSCYQTLAKLQWDTAGGFGGGGGACTSGGGGGGYQGGHASLLDDITADGQDGVSFFHPSGEIYLEPLAVVESHGELHIELYLNCSHCHSGICKRDRGGKMAECACQFGTELAEDSVTCVAPRGLVADRQLPLPLILAVLIATVILGLIFACGSLSYVYRRKQKQLEGARVRLQSTEYKLSKIRSSIIMTDYNPNYCFVGKGAGLSELKEVPRKNITLLRALGHGAFGEVYEGMVVGISGDPNPLQVAIKTLPEICSEQDEMDFLMEALIISKFSHQNIVRCIGVSLQTLPRFILLELMSGGDMKSFLRENRPCTNQPSSLTMLELLHMARDIACGCKYLEDNQFIHRDIAARNCLLTYSDTGRVAKIGDFGMARDIYRASYYRKGGRAMLPVKWMPPEAFLEGIFTSKTDTWSFGVLLWEIFSLGYMPYPCKTNQEVLEFVTSGGRMDPPKSCPGPVYRIMTQCWQHTPDHRPNFSTILERIMYCTQDPDVINTELPVESGPAPEDEGSMMMRQSNCNGLLTPLASSTPHTPLLDTQTVEHKLGELPQEIRVENLVGWNIRAPTLPSITESTEGSWIPSTPISTTETKPQEPHKLKNKTKNLWNPTYGSWVMESTC
ncbi:leukocyte tyrosine kinase receptor [Pelodytes ibericus]